jgi:hypothetical protein
MRLKTNQAPTKAGGFWIIYGIFCKDNRECNQVVKFDIYGNSLERMGQVWQEIDCSSRGRKAAEELRSAS